MLRIWIELKYKIWTKQTKTSIKSAIFYFFLIIFVFVFFSLKYATFKKSADIGNFDMSQDDSLRLHRKQLITVLDI